jgi:hypothetical protein
MVLIGPSPSPKRSLLAHANVQSLSQYFADNNLSHKVAG